MTKTSTAPKCYFCETTDATAIKRDVELESRDDADGQCLPDAEIVTELPICLDCNETWYDGTETYPALLPLA